MKKNKKKKSRKNILFFKNFDYAPCTSGPGISPFSKLNLKNSNENNKLLLICKFFDYAWDKK